MKKIIMATNNANKVKEMKAMLEREGLDIEILTPKELNVTEEPVEDGSTFEENAIIKAKFYYDRFGIPSMADDSGICIDFYNGGPGVYSARFLDTNDYSYKNSYILNDLKDSENRGAQYHCVIAYVSDEGVKTYEGIFAGEIAHEAKGQNGFGYDPIFYVPEYGKTCAEMSKEEKNSISHRAIAVGKWVKDLG